MSMVRTYNITMEVFNDAVASIPADGRFSWPSWETCLGGYYLKSKGMELSAKNIERFEGLSDVILDAVYDRMDLEEALPASERSGMTCCGDVTVDNFPAVVEFIRKQVSDGVYVFRGLL